MRLPYSRLTARTMMGVVAISGIGFGYAARMDQRRSHLLAVARDHESQVIRLQQGWALTAPNRICVETWWDASGRALFRQEVVRINLQNEWHRTMREKYRRASAQPWLPVEPDPPKPK